MVRIHFSNTIIYKYLSCCKVKLAVYHSNDRKIGFRIFFFKIKDILEYKKTKNWNSLLFFNSALFLKAWNIKKKQCTKTRKEKISVQNFIALQTGQKTSITMIRNFIYIHLTFLWHLYHWFLNKQLIKVIIFLVLASFCLYWITNDAKIQG